ncbi:SHOCT domain-containing protein [Bacillus atrophaeus]|uniref:SHOCT domain-containing protein n=1 Tax=Bacillus atrophaeus TaxID=1452 RepID=UPI002E238AED|nr:SHOCT domain-containing protein [Bacillus atrophaeus]
MAFLFENGEVYNCQFKKRMKASKNFVKTYEAAKPLLNEQNETIIELVSGCMKGDSSWGHFIATDNHVYFIVLKKKEPVVKQWSYEEIIKISISRKPMIGYKIECSTTDEDININSISEGDIDGFNKYVSSRIIGNEERYANQQKDLKKNIKEYYFKTTKTTITLDGNFVRVARKGAVNTITRGYSGEKSYRISELSGIQIKKPGLVTSGYFQFLTPAANETSGLWDAIQDDNSFTFSGSELPMVLEIQKHIEEYQSIPVQPTTAAASAPSISAADELKKYKELLDIDAITQEEYEIKKKQLLNL